MAVDCACSGFVFHYPQGDVTTGCTESVYGRRSVFRPGHDAKLKGHLIRAGRAGVQVSTKTEPDKRMSAQDAADRFGFSRMVAEGIVAERKSPGRKASKDTEADTEADTDGGGGAAADPRDAADLSKVADPGTRGWYKVGRWNYVGEVHDGVLYYQKAGGKMAQALSFEWMNPQPELPAS